MSEVTDLWGRLRLLEQALAACAYWAANGLHTTTRDYPDNRKYFMRETMLRNILKETKEYAYSEPGCDNNIMFEDFEYTYTPVGGWPEPKKESM